LPTPLPARLFAAAYGLTVLAGLARGRKWVTQAPIWPGQANGGLGAPLATAVFRLSRRLIDHCVLEMNENEGALVKSRFRLA
jgi:hypothetical protein